jgi:hypothetical protein
LVRPLLVFFLLPTSSLIASVYYSCRRQRYLRSRWWPRSSWWRSRLRRPLETPRLNRT